jgi:hypothetical protein
MNPLMPSLDFYTKLPTVLQGIIGSFGTLGDIQHTTCVSKAAQSAMNQLPLWKHLAKKLHLRIRAGQNPKALIKYRCEINRCMQRIFTLADQHASPPAIRAHQMPALNTHLEQSLAVHSFIYTHRTQLLPQLTTAIQENMRQCVKFFICLGVTPTYSSLKLALDLPKDASKMLSVLLKPFMDQKKNRPSFEHMLNVHQFVDLIKTACQMNTSEGLLCLQLLLASSFYDLRGRNDLFAAIISSDWAEGAELLMQWGILPDASDVELADIMSRDQLLHAFSKRRKIAHSA